MTKSSRSLKEKAGTEFWLSAQSLERLIFYLLILFLPTQLGKHFWPDFSIVSGIRVDYLSPTLYLTDILILFLFIKFLIFNFKFDPFDKTQGHAEQGRMHELKLKIFNFKLVLLIVILLIGIILSKSPLAGAYGLLKLLEFLFFGFYVAGNFKKYEWKNLALLFSAGIIFESLLAIVQYFQQASLGGIFYFFGERTFNLTTPGIANASLNGFLILRPYGTFSHPNVLAGYLVLTMIFVIFNLKFSIKSKFSIFNFKTFLPLTAIALGTVALLLILSRIAILLWLIILGSWLIAHGIKKIKLKASIFYILFSIFSLLLIGFIFANSSFRYRFTNINLSDESIVQRENLIRSSMSMIKDRPIFGVGLNNFLVNFPSYQMPHPSLFYLQPVHNLFLLILSEIGIVGFLFFIWFVAATIKEMKKKKEFQISNFKFQILFAVLILGMFDHYFLTLQQGQLLLALAFGLCWSKEYET